MYNSILYFQANHGGVRGKVPRDDDDEDYSGDNGGSDIEEIASEGRRRQVLENNV